MQFVTQDEPDLTLPEDGIFRARLEEIKERSFPVTDRNTGKEKQVVMLDWWYRDVLAQFI